MGSCFVDEINKRDVTTASAGGPGADEVLVAAAKDGDEQAFEVLIKRHHRRILALALRYVRVREDAEDIVQQTFQKAFVNLHRFEGKSSFSTWLTRIAINEALMLLRRGRMLREVSIDESSNREETSRDLELSDLSPDPEASCLRREAARIHPHHHPLHDLARVLHRHPTHLRLVWHGGGSTRCSPASLS
jgi:RNA polymerase sigma-70 factor (ECF subfamily)